MAQNNSEKIQSYIKEILFLIGEDPNREGLKDTPKRVAQMWKEMFRYYDTEQPSLKTFESSIDQMVIKKGIKAYSTCEHHMIPFKIVVHFAYVPNKRVVGISKIIRLVKWCSAKLSIQEELTNEIVQRFQKEVKPLGCACIIKGEHGCEAMRGVKTESETITSAVTGCFRDVNEKARDEFLKLVA